MAAVNDAVREAESLLPGRAAADGEKDPRWQAIIKVGEYLPTDPEVIWPFIKRWGSYPDDDLSDAVACCLLEHLLEEHFEAYFPLVAELARSDTRFCRTVLMCWPFGETDQPRNRNRFDELKKGLRQSMGAG